MKIILTGAILLLSSFVITAEAQLAAQNNISLADLSSHIEKLIKTDLQGNKVELLKEAKALEDRDKEEFVSLATRIYYAFYDMENSKRINDLLLKKFPDGTAAREQAYQDIFGRESKLTFDQQVLAYEKWIKKFPPTKNVEKRPLVYANAALGLAKAYAEAGDVVMSSKYVDQLKGSTLHAKGLSEIATIYNKKDQQQKALELLGEAHQITSSSNGYMDREVWPIIEAQYVHALLKAGHPEKAEWVAKEALTSDYSLGIQQSAVTLTLVNSLLQQDKKKEEALHTLEAHMIKSSEAKRSKRFIELLTQIYQEKHGNSDGFEQYLANLGQRADQAKVVEYTGKMIKNHAPDFSLINLNGETVKLSDLRGKYIVLDFWATWCIPCVSSFPGMQATVNKYQDQDDVEFLFINCWEKGKSTDDYVRNFIESSNYKFNVLLDNKEAATPEKYGIKAIPTKVFIDKEGFIRFQESGASYNVEDCVKEISAKIDLMKAVN